MSAWDYPFFIIVTVVAALYVTVRLFRVGYAGYRAPDYECDLCGRKQRGLYVREWRYCPYCGTPKPREPARY